jgi:hypothetical protein
MVKSTSNQEELDTLIHQLIQQVVKSADGSQQQRDAMSKLVSLIPNLTGIYGRTYPEAMNLALEGISIYQGNISGRNLRSFQQKFSVDINNATPIVVRKSFVNWFNRIVSNKINDQHRKKSKLPLSLDTPIKPGEQTTRGEVVPDIWTLGDLDSWCKREEKEKRRLKGYILERYIELDPDGKLQSSYPGNCPDCNCQLLLREEYLKDEGETVRTIAHKLGISEQTIYSHRRRQCLSLLRKIAQEIDSRFDEYAQRLLGE